MNIYYVYFYLRSDFAPYYVGKGKGRRAWKKGKNEVNPPKDKTRIILVEENLTDIQAFILERYYIRWFGRKDIGTGILRNKTDGGDGASGLVITEKERIRRKKTLTGRKWYNDGIKDYFIFPNEKQTSYKLGRINFAKIWVNDGYHSFRIKSEDVLPIHKMGRIKNRKKWYNDGVNDYFITEQEVTSLMAKGKLAQQGKKWFNDGLKDYFIFPKEALSTYSLGRLSQTKRRWYNDGVNEYLLFEDNDKGYIPGRLKLLISRINLKRVAAL